MDRETFQVDYPRWLTAFFALATPAFTLVVLVATWSVATNDWAVDRKLLSIGTGWVAVGALLIVPGTRYLIRIWRGIPALQIDSQGILWGNDWDRDSGIPWDQVARIGIRADYSGPVLLIEPSATFRPGRVSLGARIGSLVTDIMYGTRFAIDFRTLRVRPEELIEQIRRRYRGEIDLSGTGQETRDSRA